MARSETCANLPTPAAWRPEEGFQQQKQEWMVVGTTTHVPEHGCVAPRAPALQGSCLFGKAWPPPGGSWVTSARSRRRSEAVGGSYFRECSTECRSPFRLQSHPQRHMSPLQLRLQMDSEAHTHAHAPAHVHSERRISDKLLLANTSSVQRRDARWSICMI